jgi:hypothetical protein
MVLSRYNKAMSKKPEKRYENNYRYSPQQMKGIWKWLFISWGIFIGAALVFEFVFSAIIFHIYDPQNLGNTLPGWTDTVGTAVMVVAFLGYPLLYGAWMGGLSIHKLGPLGSVTAIVGMGIAIGGSDVSSIYGLIGGIIFVIGVAIMFYLGKLADVPMWLQLPILRSPRLYLNEPKKKKK